MTRHVVSLAIVIGCGGWPQIAWAQAPAAETPAGEPAVKEVEAARALAPSSERQTGGSEKGSALGRFMGDVGGDYRHFFRVETAAWYATGLASANIVHIWDEEVAEAAAAPTPSTRQALEGGDTYGNLTFQVPIAIGWWALGRAAHSAKAVDVSRDLLRAQISATSFSYAIKVAVGRTRPNGDPRSFPSGHATATFATAMVLQDHYGWKVGVPAFAAAAYTAGSRLIDNKHWASDVTMGAFVGIASARTVTLHLRQRRVALVPQVVGGGWAVTFVSVN